MHKQNLFVVLVITSLVVLAACAKPEPEIIEVTREVAQTVEVTREVTRIVEQTVEVAVVVTATPTQAPRATTTPELTRERLQSGLGEAIVSDLEKWRDVNRVNLVRWGEGWVEIELETSHFTRDTQPQVSWDVVNVLAETFSKMSANARVFLTGSEDFTMRLTTYSAEGDYRYRSETDFDTILKVNNRSISYEEWVQAASAGFP